MASERIKQNFFKLAEEMKCKVEKDEGKSPWIRIYNPKGELIAQVRGYSKGKAVLHKLSRREDYVKPEWKSDYQARKEKTLKLADKLGFELKSTKGYVYLYRHGHFVKQAHGYNKTYQYLADYQNGKVTKLVAEADKIYEKEMSEV